jgi:hypothetical protein
MATATLFKQTLPICGKQAVNCLTSLRCFHSRQQNVRSAFDRLPKHLSYLNVQYLVFKLST